MERIVPVVLLDITTGLLVINVTVLVIPFVMKKLENVFVHQTQLMIACPVLLIHMDIITLLVATNANALYKEPYPTVQAVTCTLANVIVLLT